jgi:hypothetical protein
MTPMADDEKSTPGSIPAMFQDWINQLSAAAGYAGGSRPSRPAPAAAPLLPGALSAAQVASITDTIAAQRRSIETLKTQLTAFDEQLSVLEKLLGPLAQWSKSWADLEQGFMNLGSRPKSEG